MRTHITRAMLALVATLATAWADEFISTRTSDVRKTRHNLSNTYSGTITRNVTSGEDEVCIFCHTPHGATIDAGVKSPLWNRKLSTATYTTYNSSSINASVAELQAGPGGTSKLCLSCHDGTLAIGSVNVLDGNYNSSGSINITMSGSGITSGKLTTTNNDTGFTRNLGTDLTNDHPISFSFTSSVATADGELRSPPFTSSSTLIVGNRQAGVTPRPALPLDNNKMQCSTCHDPHKRDATEETSTGVSIKFLRLHRFQKANPVGSSFNINNDIICLACHDKGLAGWADSAHANSTDANETYKSGASSAAEWREFPTNAKVWEMACLNCHDTHTVPGARRLLREGIDSTSFPKRQTGSQKAAVEEVCYQCHQNKDASSQVLNMTTQTVPDIKTEFTTAGNKRMPITTSDQGNTSEVHDIVDADFTEPATTLGSANLDNRHVECTDCHNPHRVMKNTQFNGSGTAGTATHKHVDTTQHENIASGVLRGAWGVEPSYTSTSWLSRPSSYTVKKGDPGSGGSTARSSAWVTREYQVCLKCHSDYGYPDDGDYPTGGGRPTLGSASFLGGTASGTNDLTEYTNQAMEFAAAANDTRTGADQGQPAGNTNHRSWHPVMWPTGRTLSARGNAASANWLSPWNGSSGAFIGNLTMYCSDCHGQATADGSSTPTVWGPHGSSKNFLLRGDWNTTSASTATGEGQSDDLCFKCHDYTRYAGSSDSGRSGFHNTDRGNLHNYHSTKIDNPMKCSFCHVAVPHGWKNKAFLVNLNDVDSEAGSSYSNYEVPNANLPFYAPPYYQRAYLKVKVWRTSGAWVAGDCGPPSGTIGKDWMLNVCEKP